MARRVGEHGARAGARRLLAAALVAAVGFVPLVAGTAAAADGVRVSDDQIPACGATVSPTGYCTAVRNAGTAAVVDDARARTGRGYLRLDTPGGGDKVTVYAQAFTGRKLSEITDLEYQTLVEQVGGPQQAPALNIPVNPMKDGSTFTTLVFEPVYTGTDPVRTGAWQTWPASSTPAGSGGWWASGTVTSTGTPNRYGFDTYTADFAAVKAALPDAVIVGGIAVNQGSGNPGLRSGVDNLRINGTTVDFDNPVVPTALAATGGNGQSAQVRTVFAQPLSATLTGAGNAPVAGQDVTFTVTGGSAAFPGGATATATTGADGVATGPALSAGDTAGPVTVTATAGTMSTTFALTVTPRAGDPAGGRPLDHARRAEHDEGGHHRPRHRDHPQRGPGRRDPGGRCGHPPDRPAGHRGPGRDRQRRPQRRLPGPGHRRGHRADLHDHRDRGPHGGGGADPRRGRRPVAGP